MTLCDAHAWACDAGRARLSSGDRYVGCWQTSQRHGQGKCVFANGDVYIGDWAHGKQDGEGVCSYATGDRWEVGVIPNQQAWRTVQLVKVSNDAAHQPCMLAACHQW